MEARSSRTFRLALLVGALALICAVGVTTSATAADADQQEPVVTQEVEQPTEDAAGVETDESLPVFASGRVVHIDQQTGRPTSLPSPAQQAAAQAHLRTVINRSSAGLFETASPTSGVMVNLQGRLRHATLIGVEPDGEILSRCTATIPAEVAAEETASVEGTDND